MWLVKEAKAKGTHLPLHSLQTKNKARKSAGIGHNRPSTVYKILELRMHLFATVKLKFPVFQEFYLSLTAFYLKLFF